MLNAGSQAEAGERNDRAHEVELEFPPSPPLWDPYPCCAGYYRSADAWLDIADAAGCGLSTNIDASGPPELATCAKSGFGYPGIDPALNSAVAAQRARFGHSLMIITH